MQKINFKNLPDKSTPINATNLNQLQDNVEASFNVLNNYSKEEQIVGIWINNKPIYRKTYQGITTFDLGDGSQLLIPASVNVDKIINYSGYLTELNGMNVLTINDVRIVKVYDNKVLFQSTNNSLKNSPYAITFEYTKTTD